MTTDKTDFQIILERFYDRIENDEKFFNYYNVDVMEATQIAHIRSKNYLVEALDYLSSIGKTDVDFSDYNVEIEKSILNYSLKKLD